MKRLREAERRKRPEGWRNQTWMLHQDNTPAHTLLLIHEFLAKHETTVVPQLYYPPDLVPPDFSFVPKVEIDSDRSPISEDRRARRKFAKGPMRYLTKCVPGCISKLEKTLEEVYRQWRGVL
jgi:hypothetical protein